MAIESVVHHRLNGRLLAQAAALWIKPDDWVVDTTYGKGNFWTEYHHPGRFTAHDIDPAKGDGVDFTELPEGDDSVDVVVLDAPYISTGTAAKSTVQGMYDAYGIGHLNNSDLWEMNAKGLYQCARIVKPGGRVFVKCMDYVESGKMVPAHFRTMTWAYAFGLEMTDEFVHYSGCGPQPKVNLDGSLRRQVHSRRAHSFLTIYTKPKRRQSIGS